MRGALWMIETDYRKRTPSASFLCRRQVMGVNPLLRRNRNDGCRHCHVDELVTQKGSVSASEAQISCIKRCMGAKVPTQERGSQEREGVFFANIVNLWSQFSRGGGDAVVCCALESYRSGKGFFE